MGLLSFVLCFEQGSHFTSGVGWEFTDMDLLSDGVEGHHANVLIQVDLGLVMRGNCRVSLWVLSFVFAFIVLRQDFSVAQARLQK